MLKDGKPVIAVSVAGGDGQDQAALQLLIDSIDFGLAPAEAVTSPRFGTNHLLGSFRQKAPDLGSLLINPEMGDKTIKELAARGHKITVKKGTLWAPVLLRIDPMSRTIQAAGDPRAKRHAAAY